MNVIDCRFMEGRWKRWVNGELDMLLMNERGSH